MSTIDIIIPAYNTGRYIGQTLKSVTEQTFQDWTLTIVDDGSTDDTASIAQEWAEQDSRIQLVRQSNTGVPGARNHGLSRLDPQSKFVIFLDSDDIWIPEALEYLMEALKTHPEAIAAHGFFREIDAEGNLLEQNEADTQKHQRVGLMDGKLEVLPDETFTGLSSLAAWNVICTTGLMLVRRAAIDKVGLFDPELLVAQDWDYWIRLARLGEFTYVNRVLLSYRVHANGNSRNAKRMNAAVKHIRQKISQSPENTPAQRRTIQQVQKAAERHFIHLKIRYAVEHLKRGELRSALRQIAYAAKHLLPLLKPIR